MTAVALFPYGGYFLTENFLAAAGISGYEANKLSGQTTLPLEN
jgi:hypothetical protein